ncbi:hypothetical protein C1N81_26775 [Streptomyces sp. SGAir0957]
MRYGAGSGPLRCVRDDVRDVECGTPYGRRTDAVPDTGRPARSGRHSEPPSSRRSGRVKPPGEVILPSIAFGCLRARLAASCSLVSLAVQSLRSM